MAQGLKASGDGLPQVLLSQQLAATEAALYTCPANTSVKVMASSLCNTTGSPVTVYVTLMKAGGTLGDGTHRLISGYPLAGNDSVTARLEGHVLGPGDVIAAFAGTAAAVDLVVSAVVFS